ncbi:TIGR03084 family protein [Aeromicrobium marinum DSM 15272]|uniref:TIGR03084 family protein n=1 Tax=Aeromicrobium marinum DSM 15272 TaxID=585531 RepID=E2S8E8_9ACTN|nr:TIGR03084 family metal-binding protein [Aeromicrobium marinum]EFQ84453.1 TIGR03084 family protein [Aeromicrobium marinum DSM 15272]
MNQRATILETVLTDLDAESEQLDAWVSGLDEAGWATVTTAEGWTVLHQVAHLLWTDRASLAAIAQGEEWDQLLVVAQADPGGFVDSETERLAELPPDSMLHHWRQSRAKLADALRGVPDGVKVPWFGPPMAPVSMATARIMETWAHGHDVAEAIGTEVPRTDRVRHICHLGVRTRGFAYLMRGAEAPDAPVRVELTGPSGEVWSWGPEDAADRVTGDGWDFGLLATRRRHRDDVDVHAVGPAADDWLDVVQAFAGLPGSDPQRLADR